VWFFPELFEGKGKLFGCEGSVSAFFYAAGISHRERESRVVGDDVQLDAMVKQLLAVHQGIVGDTWPIAFRNVPQDLPDIAPCNRRRLHLLNHRRNFFRVDPEWNV